MWIYRQSGYRSKSNILLLISCVVSNRDAIYEKSEFITDPSKYVTLKKDLSIFLFKSITVCTLMIYCAYLLQGDVCGEVECNLLHICHFDRMHCQYRCLRIPGIVHPCIYKKIYLKCSWNDILYYRKISNEHNFKRWKSIRLPSFHSLSHGSCSASSLTNYASGEPLL